MTETAFAAADRLLSQALDALAACADTGGDTESIAVLRRCESAVRRLDQITVTAVAGLERSGGFSAQGYKSTAAALADLLGWERFEARRRVVAAEQVTLRVGLDGAALPARLPATAAVFAAGQATLRHVDAVVRVLTSAAAQRLTPPQWAGVEEQLAAKAGCYTPSELHAWGTALVDLLDQDGAEPDDRPPAQVNELHLIRLPSGGGKLKGRFDDAAMFDAIAAVVDVKAKPLTGDDDRSAGQRQAEALADVCGYVLDHGPADLVPECGGHRPHVNVLVRLDDLQTRARAACLDFGGAVSPEALRMLCCDATVVPIVMNGAGQPLDVGRATRTIPDGLRRAVAATAGAPIRAANGPVVVRDPPRAGVGAGWGDEIVEPGQPLPRPPPADPLHRLDRPHPRRAPRVHPTPVRRPRPDTPPQSPPPPRRAVLVAKGRATRWARSAARPSIGGRP